MGSRADPVSPWSCHGNLHGRVCCFAWQNLRFLATAKQEHKTRVAVRSGGQLSLLPWVLLQNKTHVRAVAKELDTGGKASCHLLFSILVLLYSSEGSTFSLA